MILFPYQEHGVEFLASRRAAILADAMGLGKTVQAIVAADRVQARTILVVCPAIARTNWQREFESWQTVPRSIQVIESGAAEIATDVAIVSYALAHTVTLPHRYDLMVLDEAQHLKTSDTVRTQAVYGRTGLITQVRRAWALSGTLAPNHPGELYPHLRALFRLGIDYPTFTDRFCVVEQTIYGSRITGTNRARTAELAALLRPHLLQRKLPDVLPELPPIRWGHITVRPDKLPPRPDPSPEEIALLYSLRTREPSSADAMHLSELRRWTGIAKAPAVAELIESMPDKIVVFAIHRAVIETLGQIDSTAVIHGGTSPTQRQAIIDDFQNADHPRVLIIQINAGGVALTLTRAHRVLFAEISWSPADNAQAAARCHRIGQTQPVLAQIVSLAGSIDEAVAAVAMRKARDLVELEAHLAQ